jgi:acyl-CoA thioesterase FadM
LVGADYASVGGAVCIWWLSKLAWYVKPAYFDDVLLVETRLGEIGPVRFGFDYRVTRAPDGELIASGRTRHACVDATALRPVRLPPWLVEDLRRLQ